MVNIRQFMRAGGDNCPPLPTPMAPAPTIPLSASVHAPVTWTGVCYSQSLYEFCIITTEEAKVVSRPSPIRSVVADVYHARLQKSR